MEPEFGNRLVPELVSSSLLWYCWTVATRWKCYFYASVLFHLLCSPPWWQSAGIVTREIWGDFYVVRSCMDFGQTKTVQRTQSVTTVCTSVASGIGRSCLDRCSWRGCVDLQTFSLPNLTVSVCFLGLDREPWKNFLNFFKIYVSFGLGFLLLLLLAFCFVLWDRLSLCSSGWNQNS